MGVLQQRVNQRAVLLSEGLEVFVHMGDEIDDLGHLRAFREMRLSGLRGRRPTKKWPEYRNSGHFVNCDGRYELTSSRW